MKNKIKYSSFITTGWLLIVLTFLLQSSLAYALPLYFEANQGQANEEIKFLSRNNNAGFFLTSSDLVVVLQSQDTKANIAQQQPNNKKESVSADQRTVVLRMKMVGANPQSKIVGIDQLPGKSNYIKGSDRKKWHTGIPHYAKVKYVQIYPGVDLVYYGNQRKLEHDFVVAPSIDPSIIHLRFEGAKRLSLDQQGNLLIDTKVGEIRQTAPFAYQDIGGKRHPVVVSYVQKGTNQVAFKVGAYDTNRPLVIDPILEYSTLLGGNTPLSGSPSSAVDRINSVAVDIAGAAYVAGFTAWIDFPVTFGAFDELPRMTSNDAFVTKFDPTGTFLEYATYLGGDQGAFNGKDIAVDPDSGIACVIGSANPLSDMLTTPNAVQNSVGIIDHVMVLCLNPDGSDITYGSFFSGSSGSKPGAIAISSASGASLVYISGRVDAPATGFPIMNAFQTSHGGITDAFVAVLNPFAPADPNPLVEGESLVYSSFLGAANDEIAEVLDVDSLGHMVVTGPTLSTNPITTLFPTKNAFFPTPASSSREAFVAKFDPTQIGAASLAFSTFLGGTGEEHPAVDQGGIAVGPDDSIFVTGSTNSTDFPVTLGAFQTDQPSTDGLSRGFHPMAKP